jgi:hypothetical protein
MSDEERTIYWDGNDVGRQYAVCPALGGQWMTGCRRLNPRTRQWSGWHRVKSGALPIRKTREEAEADLAAWNRGRKLRPIGQF